MRWYSHGAEMNGTDIRICVDLTHLNKSMKHERLQLPSEAEVLHQFQRIYNLQQTRRNEQLLADSVNRMHSVTYNTHNPLWVL